MVCNTINNKTNKQKSYYFAFLVVKLHFFPHHIFFIAFMLLYAGNKIYFLFIHTFYYSYLYYMTVTKIILSVLNVYKIIYINCPD